MFRMISNTSRPCSEKQAHWNFQHHQSNNTHETQKYFFKNKIYLSLLLIPLMAQIRCYSPETVQVTSLKRTLASSP